ncbi:hypothetical protein NDU88_006866 [Pleurodeles waltl]|uniref:Uncharacterized protein n=1 Tax=Pleurodeles waltl TaxID=8319 RepID=A0AAV7WBZ3_PLEWA|nr:hypothetical protein NDU88_006866 [Pleurodeles waltl]
MSQLLFSEAVSTLRCPGDLEAEDMVQTLPSLFSPVMDTLLCELFDIKVSMGSIGQAVMKMAVDMQSIRIDIASYYQLLENTEMCLTGWSKEAAVLQRNVIDLEERSRGDNVCIFDLPEKMEGLT